MEAAPGEGYLLSCVAQRAPGPTPQYSGLVVATSLWGYLVLNRLHNLYVLTPWPFKYLCSYAPSISRASSTSQMETSLQASSNHNLTVLSNLPPLNTLYKWEYMMTFVFW